MKYLKPMILNTTSALSAIQQRNESPKDGIYDDSVSNFATAPGYSADE